MVLSFLYSIYHSIMCIYQMVFFSLFFAYMANKITFLWTYNVYAIKMTLRFTNNINAAWCQFSFTFFHRFLLTHCPLAAFNMMTHDSNWWKKFHNNLYQFDLLLLLNAMGWSVSNKTFGSKIPIFLQFPVNKTNSAVSMTKHSEYEWFQNYRAYLRNFEHLVLFWATHVLIHFQRVVEEKNSSFIYSGLIAVYVAKRVFN